MGIRLRYAKTGTVLPYLLNDELQAALIPIIGVAYNSAEQWVEVEFSDTATQPQMDAAGPLVTAHTGIDPVDVARDDIRARWVASAIHGKTPAQIYTAMQGAIDGWTSLAQAKADLRVWLPLMAAAIGWIVMRDEQR